MIVINVTIIVMGQQPIGFVSHPPAAPYEPQPGEIQQICPVCGWKNIYDSPGRAKMGIASHRQWCRRKHR